jgi:predicted phage baseplate assembly protein
MTTNPSLHCRDERRGRKVRHQGLNGIESIEVREGHRVLTVSLLDRAPENLTAANVRIDGGRRITGIRVLDVHIRNGTDPDLDRELDITLDRPGDLSTYTLSFVKVDEHGHPGTEPLDDFDKRLAQRDFSFAAGCPSDLDCAPPEDCPSPVLTEPETSYLAKDYASFRQLILDRLALIMPAWTERHIPDIGIALVELLAYVGDYLSYYQDAVATEAYLDTARTRISVHRHVRLVDYPMHDGCNARAWVYVEVDNPLPLDPAQFFFITGPAETEHAALTAADLPRSGGYEAFEPLADAQIHLSRDHNQIAFWTWGDEECCLNVGATRATLEDPGTAEKPQLHLKPGDVLIFEEVLGPNTGVPADADPTHRQAVRLTRATPDVDALLHQAILEIEWAPEDALIFPLCLSSIGKPPACELLRPSVAHGNVVLVDHGRRITSCGGAKEQLTVPEAVVERAGCLREGEPADTITRLAKFDLRLSRLPVTQRAAFPPPSQVAIGQATRMADIPDRVLRRVRQLWQQAVDGQILSNDEIAELRTIFGDRTLADARFTLPRPRRPASPANQAAALQRLLVGWRRLLAKKIRWLEDLARRARAGLELGPAELNEIRDAWGASYADGLEATNPLFAGPARDAVRQDPTDALPVLQLRVGPNAPEWTVRRDLLGSGPGDRHVVVEVDDDGVAHVRFGDGTHGRAATPGATFLADYRIGNGTTGNVGARAISQIVFCGNDPGGVTKVRNPLAAEGGTDPQSLPEVRLFAPEAFRHRLQRAVTADDYATLAGQLPGLQRAAASMRWTGSWYEAQVAVDPLGIEDAEEGLLERVREGIFRYRRIGHDLVVQPAHYVPLLLALRICVSPHVLRAHAQSAVQDAFSNRQLPDGRRGLFHPDNLTFGDAVDVSRLVAVAQAIPGVQSVEVLKLQRFSEGDHGELAQGYLPLRPLEVAQLHNDPVFPENGQLLVEIGGGR